MQSERSLAAGMAAIAELPLRGGPAAAAGPVVPEQRTATVPADSFTEASARLVITLRGQADVAESILTTTREQLAAVDAQLRSEERNATKIEAAIRKAAYMPAWVLQERYLPELQQHLALCKEMFAKNTELRHSLLGEELWTEQRRRRALEEMQRVERASAEHSSALADAAASRDALEQRGRARGRGQHPARQRREASVWASLVAPVVAAVKAQLKWQPGRTGLAEALHPALRVLARAASEEADAQALVGRHLQEEFSMAALRPLFCEIVTGRGARARQTP